jgi:Na+/H+ antiporter NhaD/arsenite permease-like protein
MASGLLSALFVNDIICLLFTPIIILICRRAQANPLPHLIGLATASNIGSAGTLIGNPQNMLIAGLSHMAFNHYLLIAMPLALFGLVVDYLLIGWFFRSDLQSPIANAALIGGPQHSYLIRKSLIVMGLIMLGILVGGDAPLIAGLGAGFMLITRRLKPNKVYASIDFNLLVIFIGLFVIIGGVEHSGLMGWSLRSLGIAHLTNFPLFAALTLVFSNIFSNVPAVLLLKFLIPTGATHLWWAGMAVFSTFAGNLTLVGSIANLIVAEMAKREGIHLSFNDYLKVGLPLTLLLSGVSLIYFSWLLR